MVVGYEAGGGVIASRQMAGLTGPGQVLMVIDPNG
jgi:hypothetical protein